MIAKKEKIRLVKGMLAYWEVPKNALHLMFNNSGYTHEELRKLFVEICKVYIEYQEDTKND